jgi:hypothetical protein
MQVAEKLDWKGLSQKLQQQKIDIDCVTAAYSQGIRTARIFTNSDTRKYFKKLYTISYFIRSHNCYYYFT